LARSAKATEDVSVSGDHFTLTGIDMCQRTKAIDLLLKDKLGGIIALDWKCVVPDSKTTVWLSQPLLQDRLADQ